VSSIHLGLSGGANRASDTAVGGFRRRHGRLQDEETPPSQAGLAVDLRANPAFTGAAGWAYNVFSVRPQFLPLTASTRAKQAERLFHINGLPKNVAQAFSL